jgi:glucose-1-phosphate cytidylyltransferase
MTRTLVLCGGRGTRAYPHTDELPKPLLKVGGRPVLRHLLEIYANQGHTDFILLGGYMVDAIVEFAAGLPSAWSVEVLDTGVDTNTGARVRQAAAMVDSDSPFFLTYADGLGDVDLARLLAEHERMGRLATLTAVPLPSQYGTIDVAGQGTGEVVRFNEKPRLPDHLINAGFLVMDPAVFDAWPDPGDDLERDVLPALSGRHCLSAYRHDGFWKSLDTYKDAIDLSELCADGPGPWLTPRSPRSEPSGP